MWPGFARVTRFSLDLARRSDAAFDPTLAPVINLWGFGEKTDRRSVPAAANLAAALSKTGWQHLTVTSRDELVKDLPELTLNLSAVAKGFGVDEMVRVLRGRGFTNVYASIAGEVRGMGRNPRGGAWKVGDLGPAGGWNESDPMVAVAVLSTGRSPPRATTRSSSSTPRAGGWRTSSIRGPAGRCSTTWGTTMVAPDNMTADALGTTLLRARPRGGPAVHGFMDRRRRDLHRARGRGEVPPGPQRPLDGAGR